MPIGKNALKRVSNNGYSKVNTSAPDMEHSEIVADKSVEPAAKKTQKKAADKSATKKPASKSAPKTVPESVAKTSTPKTVKKAEKAVKKDSHPDGFVRIGLGDDMPVYLL